MVIPVTSVCVVHNKYVFITGEGAGWGYGGQAVPVGVLVSVKRDAIAGIC